MKRPVYATAAVVATIVGLMIGHSLAAPATTPLLACGDSEMVGRFHQDILADVAGGPTVGREALADFLAKELPGLHDSEFSAGPGSDAAQGFSYSEAGDFKLLIRTIKVGDSWHVEGFEGCDPIVSRAAGGN